MGLSDSAILKFLLSSLIGRAGGRRRPVAAARGAVLVLSRRGAARELCKFWKVYVACARRVDGVKGLWEISEGATVRCHRTRNARASQIDRRPRGVLTVVGRALEACVRVATRQLSTSIISMLPTPESCQRDRAASAHPVAAIACLCAPFTRELLCAAFASPVDQ